MQENTTVPFKCTIHGFYVDTLHHLVKKQIVPGFSGFLSATGVKPKTLTSIINYPLINSSITEYSTMQYILKETQKQTEAIGQVYTINTFDLGACMKVLPVQWFKPDELKKHITLIGPFHTIMNKMGMLQKHKMAGTGYAKLLIESKLVSSGRLKKTLSGNNYALALFCIKVVSEAMERLLLDAFLREKVLNL